MAAVDFFGAFQYQWGQAATSYAWDDAQWKNGWAAIGSTPPSVAQFDAVQKVTDFKTKFLFDALSAIMTAGGSAFTSSNPATISNVLYRNPTTALRGMPTLASAAEVQTGTDAVKVLTPSTLSSRTATTTRTGLASLATLAEVQAGTNADKIVSPSTFMSVFGVDPTENVRGAALVATQAEMNAGASDTRISTPKKLLAWARGTSANATDLLFGFVRLATVAESTVVANVVNPLSPARLKTALESANYRATESLSGSAAIATTAEMNSGTDNSKFVTPAKLLAWLRSSAAIATESLQGASRLATVAETEAGTLNTVVLTPQKMRAAFGIAQGIVDVTANRAQNITYTNSTGKPIVVYINAAASVAGDAFVAVRCGPSSGAMADASVSRSPVAPGGIAVSAVVPVGHTYGASWVGVSSVSWREMTQ